MISLSVVNMKCGTAAHTLEKLQDMLSDVTDVCELAGVGEAGGKIVGKMKNE